MVQQPPKWKINVILSLISCVASVTSVISLIPQILHTCRTRSAKDLSLLMLINFFICAISWVCYGLLTGARTVWVTNAMSTVCIIILIALKIRYTKKSKG